MAKNLPDELETLMVKIKTMSAGVQERFQAAVQALVERNGSLAERVAGADAEIDSREVDLEDRCLKIIALYQPVAVDLRFLAGVIKTNEELERIADLSAKIARLAKALSETSRVDTGLGFEYMAQRVAEMLDSSIRSFLEKDIDTAYAVCESDDEIDELKHDMQKQIKSLLEEHSDWAGQLLMLTKVSESLERIADQSTNIAENAIYTVTGKIVRHRRDSIQEYSENKFKQWIEGYGIKSNNG
jgi:phosphate transport system protein